MKRKNWICFLLIFLIGLSAFAFTTHSSSASAAPILSAVLSGTTNQYNIPQQATGTTFQVDVRVDNVASVSAGINGISYNLTWNPAILECTAQKDNNKYLPDEQDLGDIAADNTLGLVIIGQVSVDTSNSSASTLKSGVSATFTFQVLSSGSCTIGIEQTGPKIAYLTYPSGSGANLYANVQGTTVMNATYGVAASLLPHGPIANFTPSDGTYFAVGSNVTLNATSSQSGYDGTEACPITDYSWLVEFANGTQFVTATGVTANFIASTLGAFRITLIVTAPAQNPPDNPNFSTTNSSSDIIQVVTNPQATILNVFTNQGGLGSGTNGGTYGPLQQVQIFAHVTNQELSISNQTVVFYVQNPEGDIIVIREGVTNTTGIASVSFRLPNPDLTAPQMSFGNWSIAAYINSEDLTVNATTYFTFSYQSGIQKVTIPASVNTSETLPIQLTINNQYLSQQWTQLSITVSDQAGVPIASSIISTPQQVQNVTVIDTTITIPSWAFPGQATVYFCLLTNAMSSESIPIAPETTATFQILP